MTKRNRKNKSNSKSKEKSAVVVIPRFSLGFTNPKFFYETSLAGAGRHLGR